MIVVHDNATNSVIEREMNAEELKNYEAITEEKRKIVEQQTVLFAEQQEAKAALLERLGITEEEARLLLS